MKTNVACTVVLAFAVGFITVAGVARAEDPKIPHERYRLPNGLEVILHQDNNVPLVAVSVWYHVGSGDEEVGKSGFAHLFEHMLFQGSENVGEDKHFAILRNIGASEVNGTTNTDRTNYFEVVPSNQIETALWLESDRMGFFLPLLNQKSLDNQIEVVRNERRQRLDNVPYGKTRFATAKALYPKGHPYRYLVIGRHEDLESSKLSDVRDFYRYWYAPANATLGIAGDFETKEVKKLVEKWFGKFAKSSRPAHSPPKTPEVKRTRTVVKDEFATLRRIDYVWHSPAFFHEGDAELDIVADVLGSSGTGRLYQDLVLDKKLAQSVSVYQASKMFSSSFHISVMVKPSADLKKIESSIQKAVAKLQTKPITKEEFDRAVVGREAAFVWGLEPILSRIEQLQSYNHFVGNPDYLSKDLDRMRKTSPNKVMQTAARFLVEGSRTEILTVPAKAKAKTAGAKK